VIEVPEVFGPRPKFPKWEAGGGRWAVGAIPIAPWNGFWTNSVRILHISEQFGGFITSGWILNG